jgi:hypothetical protein
MKRRETKQPISLLSHQHNRKNKDIRLQGGNMFKKFFVFVLSLFMAAAFVYGQAGQVGAIKGTVTTSDESVVSGVKVTLTSTAMVIDKMVTLTNQFGYYRFLSLAPGKYDLTFEGEKMNSLLRKGIVVNANVTVTVDIELQLATITEQIVVEGQAPTIDRQSVAKTATLDKDFLDSIPAARNINTYFNMTPGITGGSAQGAAVRDNSYNLDGIQMNDPVVGTWGAAFSMDIMEEISVQTSGLSAEHGSVKGAVINVITKSGGNQFHGSISGYYNHESLKSDNTKGTPLEGSSSGAKFQFEPGVTLGGPIVKDRLWFFLNLSTYRSAYYTPGFPYDKEAEVPRHDDSIYPYVKLTYQPSQNDKFVLGFSYTRRKIDNDGASQWDTEDTTNIYESPTYVFSAHWTHTFGSNMIVNLKLGAYSKELNWTAKVQDAWKREDSTYLAFNSSGWDDLNPRKRVQANFDGTVFLDDFAGSHELKFGVQSNILTGQRIVQTYGAPDALGFPENNMYYWYGDLYYSGFWASHDRLVKSFNFGVFLNDTWNLTRNLTLNLGLRFDYNRNYFPAQDGSLGDIPSQGDFGYLGYPGETWNLKIDNAITAFTWKNFSPRIGLIYDLFSDGTTLLKANYSRYLQDNYTTVSFELHPVNWVGYGAYMYPDGSLWAVDYTWIPGVNTIVGYKDQGLKTPYSTELSVGIERELWEDWSIGLRYIRRWDRNLIEDVDSTALDIEALMERGEFVWTRYEPVDVIDPHDGGTVTFWNRLWYEPAQKYMVNPPDAKRDYNAVEFRLDKRFSRKWSLNLSYVYNKSTGLVGNEFWDSEGRTGLYNDPNAHVNAYGRMPLERRHQLKIQGLVKGPLGINISGYFRYLTGRPYTRTVNSRELGVALNTDQSVNAEPRGSYLLPDLAILDLRLEKEFKFGNKLSFKVFCDIFNAFNSNEATGVWTQSSNPNYTFGEMTYIIGPRVFRFGGKIEF